MNVSEAVEQRISTRAFLPDPLQQADVRDWLTAAQRAPSGGNLQPWRTIAVTGTAKDAVIAMAASILAKDHRGQATDRPVYPPDLWEPHEARRRRVGEPHAAALALALGRRRRGDGGGEWTRLGAEEGRGLAENGERLETGEEGAVVCGAAPRQPVSLPLGGARARGRGEAGTDPGAARRGRRRAGGS